MEERYFDRTATLHLPVQRSADYSPDIDQPSSQKSAMTTQPRRSGRRPTMREVAAVAGVSLTTVSRVVNGAQDVDPHLVVRVRDAISLLGYRRDLAATMLRRSDRASATIGLLLEDVANPFFSALHRSVEDFARARGVLVFAGSSDEDPARERELAEGLVARGVDGLIITPTAGDQSYLTRERDAGIPLVFVDRPPRFIDADAVISDNAGGAHAAVEHLIRSGHSRIAHLGDRPEVFTAKERLRGYREALEHHGIAEDPELIVEGLLSSEMAAATTARLLSLPAPPTALFTSQNLITIGACHALRTAGLHETIALVGFDDVLLADALDPPLTVVAQDPAALGREAAELLFSRLDGYAGPSREVIVPAPLIARGSGELLPETQAV
jgi:LacI family transcriptional regulator